MNAKEIELLDKIVDRIKAEKIMAEIYPKLFKGCNDKAVAAKVANDLHALIDSPHNQTTTTRHTPHRSIADD